MKRRTFMKVTLAGATVCGILRPAEILAATEPLDPFSVTSEPDVLRVLFGDITASPSDAVKIKAPIQVMRGKATSFKVLCDLDDVDTIAIVTANNRYPLNTYVRLLAANGYYSTRLKVERTSDVKAYVKAAGALYYASIHIKVNLGGYGIHIE